MIGVTKIGMVVMITLFQKYEKAAWEFMENKGLKNKLVCICPGDALDEKKKLQ